MANFFKDDQGRVRKIDTDDNVSSIDLGVSDDTPKGEVADTTINQEKASDIKTLKQVNLEAKEFSLEDSVIMKLKQLEGDDVDVEAVDDDGSPFKHGDLIKLDNGAEYLIFDDYQAMEKEAHDQLENDWESEPEIFGKLVEDYQSVNETNAHLLAQDFASSALDGHDKDIARELEDDVRNDLENEEDNPDYEDMVDAEVQKRLPKALEEKESELTVEIEGKIRSDFKDFIVNQEGLVSEEDFQKHYGKWMHTNVEEMIDAIISSDGAENTISRIDGESHEVGNDNEKVLVKSDG